MKSIATFVKIFVPVQYVNRINNIINKKNFAIIHLKGNTGVFTDVGEVYSLINEIESLNRQLSNNETNRGI